MMAENKLAAGVHAHLSTGGPITEIKMFGGIGFLLNGNMVAAVSKRGLLLRVGKDGHHRALARPGTRPMEMRGRVMEGYVYVDPSALDDSALRNWLDEASVFVMTLPSKKDGKSVRKGRWT